ncbi:MAG: bifunctional diaminohydroxyphosphoribosylaminopyrimidine deaminase/5-amino-6-(5-phosphoribosylamino)uracil reductase RibD [Candidatus Margulisiibacteriota bacterium]
MKRLLKLAKAKQGISSPNPLVAAAVVKNDIVLAEGVHDKPGTKHAELIALEKAGNLAQGATLYVNLEPCTHYGKTPPCVNAIIKAGISKVIYAMEDPNVLVRKIPALKVLTDHNIDVAFGLLEKEALILNEVFVKNQKYQKPFVTLKVAQTLDGKIALPNGESKYITSSKSLKLVHQLRNNHDAILIGINTVLLDDPSLDIRFNIKQNKETRFIIVLDPNLKMPLNAKLFNNKNHQVIIATHKKNINTEKYFTLSKKTKLLTLDNDNDFDLNLILTTLYQKFGITSLLIEGGKKVFTSAISNKIVDKAYFFIAPKMILGEDSIFPFGGKSVADLDHALILKDLKVKYLNPDVLITGYF